MGRGVEHRFRRDTERDIAMDFAATLSAGTSRRRVLDMRRPRRPPVARTELAMPFDIAGISWGGTPSVPTVTLITGYVEVHGEGEGYLTPGYHTEYLEPTVLTKVLTGSGTEYIWLSTEYDPAASPQWKTPVFASGTTLPDSTVRTYNKLLWKFVGGVPSVQYHRGNIEFVGYRMVDA